MANLIPVLTLIVPPATVLLTVAPSIAGTPGRPRQTSRSPTVTGAMLSLTTRR